MPRKGAPGEGKSRPKSLATKGKNVTEMLPNNLRFNEPMYVIKQNYTWKYSKDDKVNGFFIVFIPVHTSSYLFSK